MNFDRLNRASALLLASAGMLLASTAFAQTPDADSTAEPGADAESAYGPSEIIVTAQRREERLQDVPIAINIFSPKALEAAGVADVQYLASLVPGLSISRTNSSQYYLRGVGTSGTTANSEQSVASYIDGVYYYSTYGSAPLANIERVEVLRGPQGTLFGRNVTGGVIQIVTRDPLASPTFDASIGYGNYDTVTARAYASTRLTDTLGVSLSVDFRDQGKGFGRNTTRNTDAFFRDDLTVRGKIAFEPTEQTKVTAMLQYRRIHDGGLDYNILPGTRGIDGVEGGDYGRFETRGEALTDSTTKGYFGYLRVEQGIGSFATLTSITSYHHLDPTLNFDQDQTPIPLVTANQDIRFRDFSQELQLTSNDDGPLTWTLGAYYYKNSVGFDPLDLGGSATGAPGQVRYFRRQTMNSLAGYGQATYDLTESTQLTAGLRYTDQSEKLPADHNYTLVGRDPNPTRLPFTSSTGTNDSSGWTWRLALDQKLSDDIMAYVSWNRGLKGGGFSLVTLATLPSYSPERLDAYEAGLKMEFLNGRVRINPVVFLYKFKDIQFAVLQAGVTTVSNAASATIKGFDLDASVQITPRLGISGAFEYLDAKYDSFTNATFFVPNMAPAGGAGSLFNQDASGNAMAYAPKTSASFSFNYEAPVAGGDLRIDGSARYVDDVAVSPSNFIMNPSYTLVSAGVGWTTADEKLGIRFWADNLFDSNYSSQIFESGPGIFRIPGAPRTYGVTLSTKW